jgi:hypothetical protein
MPAETEFGSEYERAYQDAQARASLYLRMASYLEAGLQIIADGVVPDPVESAKGLLRGLENYRRYTKPMTKTETS